MEETQENTLYKLAYLEIQADRKEPGIWAMALAEADGNTAKAEARYIAKRVEQLRAKPSPEPAPVAIPTPQAVPPQVSPTKEEGSETAPGQAPIPWRKIGISTAIAVTVSCVTFVVDTPRRVTAAELFGMAMGPILLGLGLWAVVGTLRGLKFRQSWKAYDYTLLVVTVLYVGGVILGHITENIKNG